MPRYEASATTPAGRVKSASVSLAFGQAAQVSADVYGTVEPSSLTLSLLKDGVQDGSETYPLTGDGSGGYDLRSGEYRGAQGPVADFGRYQSADSSVLAKPSYDADLGDAYPSATATTGTGGSTEARARTALSAAGFSLVLFNGPGIYRGEPETDSGDVETLSFLQSTLLATGARWWVEGTTFYIDGRGVSAFFGVPSSDNDILTGYSYREETSLPGYEPGVDPDPEPTDEELEGLPPEPIVDDYLSQCPDYIGTPPGYVPPEPTPEDVLSGVYEYVMEAGEGDDKTRVTRKNTYSAGILQSTEASEMGVISVPTGKEFRLRLKTTTTFIYHPDCPQAIVQQRDSTYVAPELSNIPGSATAPEVEQAADLYNALLAKANGDGLYLQSERVETLEYHLEGWLKRTLEVNRELNVLEYRAPATPTGQITLNLSYNTRTRSVVYEPQPQGQWATYTLERQTENVVVYETSAGSGGEPDTSAPATVQRVSRSTPSVQGGDQAPPQMNCPDPEPKPDTGYFWDFGDGTTVQSGPNEKHTYAADGIYNVSVILTKPGGVTFDASGTAATGATGQPSSGSTGALNLQVVIGAGVDSRRFFFYTNRTLSCVEEKQEEFDKDHADWEADKAEKLELYKSTRVNPENISKRVHNLSFGVLRLELKPGGAYGGGLLASVSHGYEDDGKNITPGTQISVWQRI